MRPRLLIVSSHPIQYQVPWFRALHNDGRVELKVLFLNLPNSREQGVGFGQAFTWDVPLLDGFDWQAAPSSTGSIADGWWALHLRNAEADMAAQEPDVVLVTGWQKRGMLQCLMAAKGLQLPLLLRAESNGLAPLSTARRLRNRWIASHAQHLLPIGKANQRYYEAIGLAARMGPKVPYFVDNQFFAERSSQLMAQKHRYREKFDIPAEALCFLFVGKLVDKKRPMDLLQALHRVAEQTPNRVHLLMVGAGPLEQALKAHVASNRLPVTFTGFMNQTEIPAAYAVADCLLLPSDYGETWGLVVNEAMACGVPAIVSDRVGCGPDLIRPEVTGLRFRFGDIERMAESMLKFVGLPGAQRREMGMQAQALVQEKYSIDVAVQGTIEAVSQAWHVA